MIDKEIGVSLKNETGYSQAKFTLGENGEMQIEIENVKAVVKMDDALKATAWLKKMGEALK